MVLVNVMISKVLISVYKIINNKTLNHWKNCLYCINFSYVLNFWTTLRTYYMDEILGVPKNYSAKICVSTLVLWLLYSTGYSSFYYSDNWLNRLFSLLLLKWNRHCISSLLVKEVKNFIIILLQWNSNEVQKFFFQEIK